MKNLIASISFCIFLSGCGGGGAPSEPATDTTANSTEAAAPGAVSDDTLPPVPPEPEPEQEMPALVISVEQLQGRLNADPPRIVDVRPAEQYAEAHIPGAVNVDTADWKSVSLSPDGLNEPDNWTQRVGGLGITRDSDVVVYGKNPTNAARIWWILRYLGVDKAAMLDGGWTAWQASGAPTDNTTPDVETVEFTPEFQADRLVRIEDLAADRAAAAAIIDTRSDAEYDGTGGPGRRHGHIPGAVHIEWSEFMTDDGRFRSTEEIQNLLHERGIEPAGDQVVHCQSGGRASVAALAMELAGYGHVRNYYCGWSEWGASLETPVETEAAGE